MQLERSVDVCNKTKIMAQGRVVWVTKFVDLAQYFNFSEKGAMGNTQLLLIYYQ